MSFPAWTADSALTTHSLSGQKSFSTVHSVNMVHGVAVTVTNISATSNGLSMSSTDANSPIAMPESSARSTKSALVWNAKRGSLKASFSAQRLSKTAISISGSNATTWSSRSTSCLQNIMARRLEMLLLRLKLVETRSEEHTSELQSLMRISYAVFCLKKKKHNI